DLKTLNSIPCSYCIECKNNISYIMNENFISEKHDKINNSKKIESCTLNNYILKEIPSRNTIKYLKSHSKKMRQMVIENKIDAKDYWRYKYFYPSRGYVVFEDFDEYVLAQVKRIIPPRL